ncbi:DGQHR domain-containing protein [Sphingomonas sanxanigenens]|nr:DGQHR domain-containing protein [Sphingomonas sanxanigenens]
MFMFSMPATALRALSEPFRRRRDAGAAEATGIQRNLDEDRARLIQDYVKNGFPYSEMSSGRRNRYDLADLRNPGWLPTAIIVNILPADAERRGRRIHADDVVTINGDEKRCALQLPVDFDDEGGWLPDDLPPFEVIDGQHRLYAFDSASQIPDNFELPVVAFHGLDIAWQAYLFWTINISPKKISRSHAFDLYPLLRTQDWLEKFDEAVVYREARAQELTETLFSHPASVWNGRINMLGVGREQGRVSQAGWIRAMISTILARRSRSGAGLFGENVGFENMPLPWSRAQQAAFLIESWSKFLRSVNESDAEWAVDLRGNRLIPELSPIDDPAFTGPHTLINQEQGVRGLLTIVNEYFFRNADRLNLASWLLSQNNANSAEIVSRALESLAGTAIEGELQALMEVVATFDWRSSDAPNLDDVTKRQKQAYRGSGGYSVLRSDLYSYLAAQEGEIGNTFSEAARR